MVKAFSHKFYNKFKYTINKLVYVISPHKRYIHKDLNKFLPLLNKIDDIYLDIGGGNSPYNNIFSPFSSKYISTDVRGYPTLDIISDATKLPLKNNSVGVILLIEVLEHIPATKEVLQEINRILRPGGHLVLTVPFIIGYHDSVDYYRFTEDALKMLLKKNGFEIKILEKRGGIFSSLSGIIYQIPSSISGNHKVLSLILLLLLIPIILILPSFDFLDRKKSVTLGYDILCSKTVCKSN